LHVSIGEGHLPWPPNSSFQRRQLEPPGLGVFIAKGMFPRIGGQAPRQLGQPVFPTVYLGSFETLKVAFKVLVDHYAILS
jgi:hypothetical protein